MSWPPTPDATGEGAAGSGAAGSVEVLKAAEVFGRAVARVQRSSTEAALGMHGFLGDEPVTPSEDVHLLTVGLAVGPSSLADVAPAARLQLHVVDPDAFGGFLAAVATVKPPDGVVRALRWVGEGWLAEVATAVEAGRPGEPAAVIACAAAMAEALSHLAPEDTVARRLAALAVSVPFGHLPAFQAADALGLFDGPGLGGPSCGRWQFNPVLLRAAWGDVLTLIDRIQEELHGKAYAAVLLTSAAEHLRAFRDRAADLDRLASNINSLAAVQPGVRAVLDQVETELARLAAEGTAPGWRP